MTRRRTRRGFTLLELLVVLVLLAITAAAAVPAFLGDAARSPEQRIAVAIAEQLIAVRDAARESGVSATMVLSPTDGRYWIAARDSATVGVLPMTGGVTIAGEGAAGGDRIELRFEPTGPTTAVAITVHGSRALTVRTQAWTGEISVDDGRTR